MWTRTRVSEKIGLQFPIVQGAFGGGSSSVALASTVSEAGGLGSFGCHHLKGPQIVETANAIRAKTKKPFAINLWIPLAGESELKLTAQEFAANVRRLQPYYDQLKIQPPAYTEKFSMTFDDQIAGLFEARPPVFSFVFGIPSKEILAECRRLGIVTMGTVTNIDEAIAMNDSDVDLIVASGSEAGGHRTSFLRPADESPATAALIPQVVDRVKKPVIVAGGIACGRGIVAAMAWGAEGVQVGSAFLACDESNASAAHRAALFSERTRATVLTNVFSGRLARGMKNRFLAEMRTIDRELPPYPIQNWFTGALRKAAAAQGETEMLALWAGQNSPQIRFKKANDLIRFLLEDTDRSFAKLAERMR